MKRRDFIQTSLFGTCAATSLMANKANAQSNQNPNIVFIMADDLGWGHLGCYGQEKIKTPNIDRLAEQGLRFTQCYAGAPVCAPSRSVLMTGIHGGKTSVRGNSGGIPLLDEDITIAEVLKQADYKTGIFGKWGLGDAGTAGVPNKQGFDEFFGYLHQVHAHFYYPYFLWKNDEKYPLPGNEGGKREQYTHDEIVDHAEQFIRENQDNPFLLYLPLTIPHTELLVPEDSFAEYDGKFPEPNPYTGDHYADQPKPRTAFAAMVTRMDRDIGRLMDVLDELDLSDNTIVIFTSDNGGQDGGGADIAFFNGNAELRGDKGELYEGGIRVPGIVRWPGKVEAGAVSDYVWAFDDVLPTLADIAGLEPPDKVTGVSFLPTLLGNESEQESREFFYWEMNANRRAVRSGKWKAIMDNRNDDDFELYDLSNDISESNNVADEYPEVVKRMKSYMDTRTTPRDYEQEPPTWGYKPEETGYVR